MNGLSTKLKQDDGSLLTRSGYKSLLVTNFRFREISSHPSGADFHDMSDRFRPEAELGSMEVLRKILQDKFVEELVLAVNKIIKLCQRPPA